MRTMALRVVGAVALVVALAGMAGRTAAQTPGPQADCPDTDRVSYSAVSEEAMREISLSPMTPATLQAAVAGLPAERSPHGTAAYFMREANMLKEGPWTTTVYVHGNPARPIHLAIQFSNHANGGVRARWLNEKLLFLQVWRGRVWSTDLVLDVESMKFIYFEAANFFILTLPCDSAQRRGPHKGR